MIYINNNLRVEYDYNFRKWALQERHTREFRGRGYWLSETVEDWRVVEHFEKLTAALLLALDTRFQLSTKEKMNLQEAVSSMERIKNEFLDELKKHNYL